MLKWLVLLLIVAGSYYAVQDWPEIVSRWNDGVAQLTNAPAGAAKSSMAGGPGHSSGPGHRTPAVESWGIRSVAGLQVNIPFPLEFVASPVTKPLPANVHLEFYQGQVGTHFVLIGHATISNFVGGIPLWIFDKPAATAADVGGLDVISSNSATTLLNGFRARRSDYISKSSPRQRVRIVLLERANQAWMIETHAMETDAHGEDFFQQIANSAR